MTNCNDIGIWIFITLLVVGMAYWIYIEIRFQRQAKNISDRLSELERATGWGELE